MSRLSLLSGLLVLGLLAPASAQFPTPQPGNRRFAEKPLWVLWHTGFTEQRALAYIKAVAEQTGIESDLEKNLRDELNKEREDTRPVKGTAMFMVKSIIPAFEELEFRALEDDSDLDKIVNQRRSVWGGREAKVTGTGNVRKLEISQTWETQKRTVVETVDENGRPSRTVRMETDEDGKPVMETHSWSQVTYFRVEDGILFEARFPELHDMKLPVADSLGLGRRARSEDLYFHADLKQVPKGLKDIFWATISTQANAMIQQRDDESPAPYEFRKSSADTALELLRMAVFDIEEATGWIRLASDTEPVRARFDIQVRSNSQLARSLKDLGKARSRLAAPRDAVVSIRSTWAMPEAFRKMVSSAGPFLREIADQQLRTDEATAGLHSVATALEATAANNEFEALLNFGGAGGSGPTLYGAIRAEEGDQLTSGLQTLLQYAIDRANENGLPQIDAFDSPGGSRYVRLSFPDMPWPTDMKPDHAFLTSNRDAVWFAVGNEDAWKVLEQRMGEPGQRGRSALLELSVDLARLLDDSDPEGLGDFGRRLDVEFDALVSAEVGFARHASDIDLPPTRELLEAVLADGGRRLSVALDADTKGLFVRAEVDEPLARYLTARYMSTMNRVMMRQRAFMEERMREEQERAEKAARDAMRELKSGDPKSDDSDDSDGDG